MKRLAAIVVMALLLVGCSAISNGTITAKKYQEAYDYPVQTCSMYETKKDGEIVCKLWTTRWEHMSERWVFDLERGQQKGFVYVSESEFEKYSVGDYYDNLGER